MLVSINLIIIEYYIKTLFDNFSIVDANNKLFSYILINCTCYYSVKCNGSFYSLRIFKLSETTDKDEADSYKYLLFSVFLSSDCVCSSIFIIIFLTFIDFYPIWYEYKNVINSLNDQQHLFIFLFNIFCHFFYHLFLY